MSKKPGNRPPQQAAPPPRPLPEIEVQNAQLCDHAGRLQYQIFVFQRDLERTNETIMNLNYEAKARKDLDAKAEPKEEV